MKFCAKPTMNHNFAALQKGNIPQRKKTQRIICSLLLKQYGKTTTKIRQPGDNVLTPANKLVNPHCLLS